MSESLSIGPMDVQDVMRMLMHRYPFLLVDRVVECVPGRHIVGIKNIARNEPLLDPSRRRELPRLLLIEALAQVSVILTYKTLKIEPTGQELMFFAGIDDANFRGDAVPGDQLSLRSDVHKLRKTMGWFRAQASIGDRQLASMSMLAAIRLPS